MPLRRRKEVVMIGAGGEEGRVFGIRVLVFLILCDAEFARAGEEGASTSRRETAIFSRIRQPGLPPEVRVAIQHAHSALDDPRCREIFREFRDGSGNTLQDRLDAVGQTGQEYLDGMRFYDGGSRAPCRRSSTLAATTPGHRVVFYCPRAFATRARRDRGGLAVTILHEELHSLGLGENPPTSQEISRRVAERCR